jgi:trigger factor
MRVVVNELEGCKRGLEVEVPGDIMSSELERTYRDYSRRARVPGFRKGKIPMEVVRQRFGKEVRDEVVDRMVREYAMRALEEKKLQPVQAPVLDEVNYESGSPMVFKATFEGRFRL